MEYTSPLGILGKVAGRLVLEQYMCGLIAQRARFVKRTAETNADGRTQ
jgi:hypothetical protein